MVNRKDAGRLKDTLYVSDLDGTLLNKDAKVSRLSEEIIGNLISKGMKFTIATARSWTSASKIVNKLKLTIPVATYNGAFIVNPVNGCVMESNCLEQKQAEYILNTLVNADIYPLVYALINQEERISWISGKENESIQYYLESKKGDKRLRSVVSTDDLSTGHVFYVTAVGPREKLEPLIPIIEDQSYLSYTFQMELYRDEYWLEIKRFDATKATGIQKIKKISRCSRVISFGDSINDLPMFSVSDEAYAVAGANPKLIEAAKKVIGSANDHGVALWLRENVLIKASTADLNRPRSI